MSPLALAALCLVVLAVVLAGTRVVLAVLLRRAILDHPNERSSHHVPTPRGGGLAVVPVLAAAWIAAAAWSAAPPAPVLVLCGLALGSASFLDRALNNLLPGGACLAGRAVASPSSPSRQPGPIFGACCRGRSIRRRRRCWVWYINLSTSWTHIDGVSGVGGRHHRARRRRGGDVAGLGPALPAFG